MWDGKINRKYSLFLFLLFLITCPFLVKGQENTNPPWEELFMNRHYSFTIIPGITAKARFKKSDDRYNLNATPQGHLTFGFGYYIPFGQKQSLVSGINFCIVGRNFQYTIPAAPFDSTKKNTITMDGAPAREYEFAYFAVPLIFENRWIQKSHFINFFAGASFCYGVQKGNEGNLASVIVTGRPGSIQYFEMSLNKDNENKPWVTYNLGGGYGFLLSNKNVLKANLHINISNTFFMKAPYRFELPGETPSIGIYKVNGSFIGVAVSYIFTRSKKMMERLKEKEF